MRAWVAAAFTVVVGGWLLLDVSAQGPGPAGMAHRIERVADGVYYATSNGTMNVGANSPIFVDDDEVLIVDSEITPAAARALVADIRTITPKPVRFVVDSHYHYDHAHGNQIFGADVQVIGHETTRRRLLGEFGNVLEQSTYLTSVEPLPARIATMRERLGQERDAQARTQLEQQIASAVGYLDAVKEVRVTPPTLTMTRDLTLFRGGREIRILYLGRGHTDTDIVVYLPKERIVATGDLMESRLSYMGDSYPEDWIETLEKLKALDFDTVMPGHGVVFTGKQKITAFQQYLRDVIDQVAALRAQGLSAEAAAARVDTTKYRDEFPQITGVGVAVAAVQRLYQLAENPGAAALLPEPDDMLAKIRAEGLERSQVDPVFDMLTTRIGPRLTASPAQIQASEYARGRLAANGLSNVHIEPWAFGRGWTLDRLEVEMIEPRYLPLIGYADGWSNATAGDVVGAPILVGGRSPEDVAAMRDRLKGAIVFTQPPMARFVRTDRPQPSDPSYVPRSADYATSVGRRGGGRGTGPTPAQRVAQILGASGAGVLVKPSVGEHGTVFVTGRDQGPGAPPSITLSGEHYNLIMRMVEDGLPVRLRVRVAARFNDGDGNALNVIGELPGTDPVLKDQIVMIGAHLDSWHTGVGATDNADGSTTVIEAMRILKAAGAAPRRTIRVALWSGEEQGLLGSRAWVQAHLAGDANRAERERFDVYFNIDNGTGPIYGFFNQDMPAVAPIFDTWLAPLTAFGARRNVIESVGSTDHLSFIDAGVPGFNPVQDYVNYDVRTHHTNMDTPDRLDVKDIRQAAIVMAWFAYQAAMRDEMIPRP